MPASPSAFPAPPRAVVDAALRAVNWPKVQKQVLAFACTRTKSKAQAEDLVQEAIRRAFDPEETAWNPLALPDVTTFLMSLVRRNASNERSSARYHHEVTVRSDAEEIRVTQEAERVATMAPTPEASLADHELCARRLAAMRARAAADPLVLTLIDAMEADIETPAEQVESLGIPLEDVRRGRRRMFDHADAVARELPSDGKCDHRRRR